MTTRPIRTWFSFILVGLFTCGCFYDTDKDPADVGDTDDGGSDGGVDGGGDTGNVSGTVTIAEGLDSGSYAVADLYLAFLAECPAGMDPVDSYGVFVAEDLDFSAPGATRVFAINGAPAGTSFLSVFLDSNDTVENPEEPAPDNPDAVATSCAEIDLAAGETVTDVEVTLDLTMPVF
jgi:hypothetical protein